MKVVRIAIALMFAVTVCAGAVSAAETVKVGVLAPLTGFAAADGRSVENSVKLAKERINEQGGVLGKDVELVIYDDRADTKEAVALSRKLIQQDQVVAAVGGSYSMPSRAAAQIFNAAQIPFVAAYAVHPDITKAGEFCFRNGFLGTVEGKAAAYVTDTMLEAKTVAMLHADNDFGHALAEGFRVYAKEHGIEILYDKAYPFQEKDYSPYLSRIKELEPDVIVGSGYYFQAGPMIKQARNMGIDAPFIGDEGADSPKFFEIAGDAAEGFIIVTNFNRGSERDIVKSYLSEYRSRFDMEPDMVGASAYDALLIITESINKAGTTDPVEVQQAMENLEDFAGLTGIIKGFTEIGEVVKPVQVQIAKDGRYQYYGVVEEKSLITP
ncbi:MAG: ABC transporter substrate-binding protein [Synergistales bacterium]|nr:ABC transporter substrate-binding protein [Synergistales bacterium]